MQMTTAPTLMDKLLAQVEEFVAAGGQDWDLSVIAASLQPASRGRGPGWVVRVATRDGMGFEVQVDPVVDDVAGFLAELANLPPRPLVAKDDVVPLVVH